MFARLFAARSWLVAIAFALTLLVLPGMAFAQTTSGGGSYKQTNLVSNVAGLAKITDADLINPWGFSHSATSPFWVSNQGTNTSTLYNVTGSTNVTKNNINPPSGHVLIPTTATGPCSSTSTWRGAGAKWSCTRTRAGLHIFLTGRRGNTCVRFPMVRRIGPKA